MTAPDLAELRRLAEDAAPGPWRADTLHSVVDVYGKQVFYGDDDGVFSHKGRDVAFIIAANPATVLALLDRLEAAEKITELARRVVHHEDQSAECAQWRDWDGAEMHDDAAALAMDKLRAALDGADG